MKKLRQFGKKVNVTVENIHNAIKVPQQTLPEKGKKHKIIAERITAAIAITDKIEQPLKAYLEIYIDGKTQGNMLGTQFTKFITLCQSIVHAFNAMQLSVEDGASKENKEKIFINSFKIASSNFEESSALRKLDHFVDLFKAYYLLDNAEGREDKKQANQKITESLNEIYKGAMGTKITRGLVRTDFLTLFNNEILSEMDNAFDRLIQQIHAEIIAIYTAPFWYLTPNKPATKPTSAAQIYESQVLNMYTANVTLEANAHLSKLEDTILALRNAFCNSIKPEKAIASDVAITNCVTAIKNLCLINDNINKSYEKYDSEFLQAHGEKYSEFKMIHREKVLSICANSAQLPKYTIIKASLDNIDFLEKNLFANLILAKIKAFLNGFIEPIQQKDYYQDLFGANERIKKSLNTIEDIFIKINEIINYSKHDTLDKKQIQTYFTNLKMNLENFKRQAGLIEIALKETIYNYWLNVSDNQNSVVEWGKAKTNNLVNNLKLDKLIHISADMREQIGKSDTLTSNYQHEYETALAEAKKSSDYILNIISNIRTQEELKKTQNSYTNITDLLNTEEDVFTHSSTSDESDICVTDSPPDETEIDLNVNGKKNEKVALLTTDSTEELNKALGNQFIVKERQYQAKTPGATYQFGKVPSGNHLPQINMFNEKNHTSETDSFDLSKYPALMQSIEQFEAPSVENDDNAVEPLYQGVCLC